MDLNTILRSATAKLPPEIRAEVEVAADVFRLVEERERCEASLYEFVRAAWSSIDSSEFQDNWAVQAYCEHLEAVTFGNIKRLLSNFPPRCSKTLVTSVCWPAWVWAQSDVTYLSGPQVRFLCGSYGERLSFEGSNLCRRLILSPWYQRLWGHRFALRDDQNSKCLIRGTLISMADGRLLPIEEIKAGDRVLSYDVGANELVADTVINGWCSGMLPTKKIKVSDGTSVIATLNHRLYGWDRWSLVEEMKVGDPIGVAAIMPSQNNYDLASKIDGGLSWRAIKEIEDIGEVETWHLETKRTSLFFANGMLSHNSKFDNTKNGSRIATSVGGSLLGLGGDIVIVDDPHQTEEVESEDVRAKTIAWWNEIHTSRLNSPIESAVVVVMQRLHNSDVSGVILDSDEDWCHFVIPMVFDEKQVRRCITVALPQYDTDEPWQDQREDGGLMWPERFSPKEIEGLRRLGDWFWSGRYQQSPVPAGGGIIKREFWQPWDNVEAQRYGLEWSGARREYPDIELVVASLDTAYGEKEENDYNALTVWGIWIDMAKNRRAMLMFAWAKRLPLHSREVFAYSHESKAEYEARQKENWGLVEWVADTCKRYKVRRLLIEDKTRGRDVANELKRLYVRENWGIELLVPTKDKVTRVHSIVPMFTDNMIYAPDTKWADDVISQAARFPKDEHDDWVDTISMFLLWAREKELLVRADEMSAAMEEEAMWKPHEETVAETYGV